MSDNSWKAKWPCTGCGTGSGYCSALWRQERQCCSDCQHNQPRDPAERYTADEWASMWPTGEMPKEARVLVDKMRGIHPTQCLAVLVGGPFGGTEQELEKDARIFCIPIVQPVRFMADGAGPEDFPPRTPVGIYERTRHLGLTQWGEDVWQYRYNQEA